MTTLRPNPKNIQVERTDSLVLQPLDGPKRRGQPGIAITKEYQARRVLRRLYNLCRYRSKHAADKLFHNQKSWWAGVDCRQYHLRFDREAVSLLSPSA